MTAKKGVYGMLVLLLSLDVKFMNVFKLRAKDFNML